MTPVVLVSTGRTGTRFFADLMGRHAPVVHAVHDSRYSTFINVLSNLHLAGWLPGRGVTLGWRALKGRELSRVDCGVYFDSNNHLYALATLMPELYPGLRLVHIVRDPRTYIASHLNWARGRPKSYLANFVLPFWQPNGTLTGDVPWSRWRQLDEYGRFAWIWSFKNRLIQSAADRGTPYLCQRFEDYFQGDAPQTSYRRLCEFIGVSPLPLTLDAFRWPVNSSRAGAARQWRDWDPKTCWTVHQLCGAVMERHGYGVEPEWQDRVAAGRSHALEGP